MQVKKKYLLNKIRFNIDKHIQKMIKICYNIIDLNEKKSILLSIFEYLVRQLPINYGVHTIINICTMIVIIKVFYNIDMLINIKAIMLCTIFMFICEALDMLLLNLVFGDKVQTLMNNYVTKIICGTPSLIFYLIIIWGVYIVKKRKKNEGC